MGKIFEISDIKQPKTTAQPPLEGTRSYEVGGTTFIVEPVFKPDAKDTLAMVLLRLIQSDTEAPKIR